MICIRQATIADKAAIFEFLAHAYKGREAFKFPYRWEWAFERNPFLQAGRVPVQIAVNEQGDVIGQSAALVEPLLVNGQEFQVGWGVDFFVLQSYRRQGIGNRLQAANNQSNDIFMSLSMSRPARKIKSKLGMYSLSPLYEFVKNMHCQQVLDQVDTKVRIEAVDVFDDEANALWERLWSKFSTLIRRDKTYLNWKFVWQPHMAHIRFMAWQQETLVGYIIIRHAQPPENNVGIICDLFADPDDDKLISTLIVHAINHFRSQQVDYIIAAMSVPSFQASLRNLGFKATGHVTPMIRADIDIPKTGCLFGKGDHDWDQYPLA